MSPNNCGNPNQSSPNGSIPGNSRSSLHATTCIPAKSNRFFLERTSHRYSGAVTDNPAPDVYPQIPRRNHPPHHAWLAVRHAGVLRPGPHQRPRCCSTYSRAQTRRLCLAPRGFAGRTCSRSGKFAGPNSILASSLLTCTRLYRDRRRRAFLAVGFVRSDDLGFESDSGATKGRRDGHYFPETERGEHSCYVSLPNHSNNSSIYEGRPASKVAELACHCR
jgi:hypothetical protein